MIHISEFGDSVVHLLFHVILSHLHKFHVNQSCLHIVGGKRIIIFQFRILGILQKIMYTSVETLHRENPY